MNTKRLCFAGFLIALFLAAGTVFGQEKGAFALGALVEANANTRHGYGLAFGLSLDYNITDHFALGLRGDYGTDFYDVSSAEAMLFARWYFLRPFGGRIFFPIFIQVAGGATVLWEGPREYYSQTRLPNGSTVYLRGEHPSKIRPSWVVDAGLGMRFRLGSAGWYTEQILQGGWPDGFRFNFGIGYQFGRKKLPIPVVEKEPEPEPVEEDHTVEFEPPPPPDEDMYSGGGSTVAGVILFPANDSTLYSKKEKPNGLDDFTMTWNDRTFNLVSKFIQSNTGYKVVVEGFANPTTGTEEENIQFLIPLSMARAEYVMNELIKMGVPPENIEIKASGNKDAMTRTALENRRVEMRFERK